VVKDEKFSNPIQCSGQNFFILLLDKVIIIELSDSPTIASHYVCKILPNPSFVNEIKQSVSL
jgi:hypothetical protein